MIHWQRIVDQPFALLLLVSCCLATAALICLLKPLLVQYALARPNARSSHKVPTPQGGGLAIVAVVCSTIVLFALFGEPGYGEAWVSSLLIGLVALAIAGALDDIRPLPVLPRLVVQICVSALLVGTLPADARLATFVPFGLERAVLVVALVWFVNLTNFMDGIDWMTVVEVVPIAACIAALGLSGVVPELAPYSLAIVALLGAMIGFAPFNRHVARLFLGDVGSLPIGAFVGWLLIVLALGNHVIAALILPLYYLCDATITLGRRFLNGEKLSQAHRSHFYQRAVIGGYTVPQVTRDVLMLNLLLVMLAVLSITVPNPVYGYACLAAAFLATFALLWRFEKGRRP